MKRKKSNPVKTTVIMFFVAAVILAAYFALSSKNEETNVEAAAEETEIEKLLGKNIEESYPPTPREVIKLYSRILKCLYSEEMEESRVKLMTLQLRKLFDEELLANNPESEHIKAIEADIAGYRVNSKSIMSYSIEKAGDVIYNTVDGRDCATLRAYYTTKEKNEYKRSYEEFILRKNDNGVWKILGWRESSSTEMNFD